LTPLSNLLVIGIPLLLVVFGLVEFTKSLGLKGKILLLVSMFIGLILGMAYQISIAGLPATFSAWFGVVIFGLAIGLTASGFYDFLDKRFPTVKG
jgi:hypothetical protein